jgi:hypothetical protein
MIEVFFSYSHKDEALMHRVRKQLVLFDRQGRIAKWWDRKIDAGGQWKEEIHRELLSSKIVLLLVSPNFLASDYCYEIELAQAMKQHEEKKSIVVPVILRPCAWQSASFGRFQAVPKDGKAITQWKDRDEACLDVATRVMKIVKRLEKDKS